MIIGIGNDLVAVERVAKACEKEGFLTRTYTAKEIAAFKDKPQSLAGNFAVKEAVAKCFENTDFVLGNLNTMASSDYPSMTEISSGYAGENEGNRHPPHRSGERRPAD